MLDQSILNQQKNFNILLPYLILGKTQSRVRSSDISMAKIIYNSTIFDNLFKSFSSI